MGEDELDALFRGRQKFFIEQIGRTASTNTVVDNAHVANEKFDKTIKADPRKKLQDEISRKLTKNIIFSDDFYQEYYPGPRKKAYAYRQPFGHSEIIEHFVRNQLRSPLTLMGQFEKESLRIYNFPLGWSLIHALTMQQEVTIKHCFLAHQEDQPREVIMRESAYYHKYATHLIHDCRDISADCHRLFLITEIDNIILGLPKLTALLSLDIREGYNVCGLARIKVIDPERIPMSSLHQRLDIYAKIAHNSNGSLSLHTPPDELYKAWIDHSKKLLYWRHRSTRQIDRSLQIYSQLMRGVDNQFSDYDIRLHELNRLHQLKNMISHWLYQRQHICAHADSMWQLRAWLQQRFHRVSADFLNHAYQGVRLSTDRNFLSLAQDIYAEMTSSIIK